MQLSLTIAPIIEADSLVVSDGSASCRQPGSQEKLNHIIVENNPGKRAVGAYHIQHLNAYHSRLKLWINEHFHGVATKYLPRYPGGQHEIEKKHIQNAMDLFQVATHRIPQLQATQQTKKRPGNRGARISNEER